MDPTRVGILEILRPRIRARWSAMLRAEPVTTPLANPAILERLFNTTLDEVFSNLRAATPPARAGGLGASRAARTNCGCGQGPLTAYFLTCERALLETLQLIEGWQMETGATELCLTVRQLARRELDAFCSVCQSRPADRGSVGVAEEEYAIADSRSW